VIKSAIQMQSSRALQVVFVYLNSSKVHQGIKRFPLYHAFASIMSSMVSGRETVVNPSEFINLFRQSRNINPERGMLEDGEEEQAQEVIHEDAHEYLLDLEDCLLNELTQKEDGSNDTDYDDELYTNMMTFWELFR